MPLKTPILSFVVTVLFNIIENVYIIELGSGLGLGSVGLVARVRIRGFRGSRVRVSRVRVRS